MNTEAKQARCAVCGHAVVNGVACDWQPADCPYLQEDKQVRRRPAVHPYMEGLTAAAGASEFDAVRGTE